MKYEKSVIYLSIFFGLLLGLIDGVVDYFAFYEHSFLGLVLTDIPMPELFMRFLLLISFTIYGIMISRIMHKRGLAEEATRSALIEVRDARNKTESIIACIGDAISIVDHKFRIIYQNEICENIFGYRGGEHCYEAYEGNKKICDGCAAALTFLDGQIHRTERTLKIADKDMCVEIIASPLTDAEGKVIACIELLRDVTERKQAEQSLQLLSTRNEAILTAVPDIIMEVDENKVYTWVNAAGYKFFGEDVIGKEAAHYFEGEQDTYKDVKPVFNGRENVVYVESWQRRIDGAKRLLAWWCRVLKDSNGKVTGALSTARDITEHKRAKEALLISKMDLEIQKLALEEKNIALHEVLDNISLEKEKVKKDVQANVEKLLLPTLEKIKIQCNSVDCHYVDMLRQDLESLATSFGSKITAREIKLAPREIEICHHIKIGHTNKKIADLLHIDIRTVETHRNRIRKKLGISHKDINLTTYLQSLDRSTT